MYFAMYLVLHINGNAVWQSITYDLISRKVVYNILEFGNLMKLVRLIKMFFIAFYCFLPVQYLIIYLYSNKLHSIDIFL